MITKVYSRRGMGDALNTRAFLLSYCEQKGIKTSSIRISTPRHWTIFEGEGFTQDNSFDQTGLTWYTNFSEFDLEKKIHMIKYDKCLSVNAGINFTFDMIYPLKWNTKLDIKLPKKYITVNYGHDNVIPDNTICTKLWSINYWEKLVKSLNIPCVQIGAGKYCKNIPGVTLNLVNKLSIKESAEVLKRALFHIDTEGGLTILNHHLGGRTVVLFGPTDLNNLGRSKNLNLRNSKCLACNGAIKRPPKRRPVYVSPNELDCKAHCMKDLTPEYVANKIYSSKWL